jgi:hypothetical protein
MEENKTIVPEEAVEEAVEAVKETAEEIKETVEEAATEVAEAAENAVEEAAEAVEGEECGCECCENGEEKPAKKNVGRKIGIAATVGTIALGAAAYAAVKIFKRK